jgi:hypothetical protein
MLQQHQRYSLRALCERRRVRELQGGAVNTLIESIDSISSSNTTSSNDLTTVDNAVYAVFRASVAAVPEPGTIGVTLAGLAMMLARRRRR